MKLCSWNVNGIRALLSKNALQPVLDQLNPDVICLQETKAERNQVEVDLPDYEEFWNSANRKGYSGTAIFTKTKPISVRYGLPNEITKKYDLENDNYGNPDEEGRIMAMEFEKLWVVTVYTPNSKGDLSRLGLRHEKWDPAFLEYLTQLRQSKPVIFCGDLNVAHNEIDLANPKQNVGKHGFTKEERAGFDAYEKAGLIDIFRLKNPDKTAAYTWWSHWANSRARNVGWRIDYWMVDDRLIDQVKSVAIHPEFTGSDHCPISLEIEEK